MPFASAAGALTLTLASNAYGDEVPQRLVGLRAFMILSCVNNANIPSTEFTKWEALLLPSAINLDHI